MGRSNRISFVIFIIIVSSLWISVFSCSLFENRDRELDGKLGDITKIRVSLSPESLNKLYTTVMEDDYAPCLLEEDGKNCEAKIRVRGFTSRLYPKKSFTVKMQINGKVEKYTLEDFAVQNRIAFFTYNKVGLRVPATEGVALFINSEYLGCYTKIPMYDQETLKRDYYGKSGQLFKCYFQHMGYDQPLRSLSEKKFPDDTDFSRLEKLVYNAVYMGDEQWFGWLKENVDKDLIVKYMVVHDFLAVGDTNFTNYCLYDYGKFFLLPWDNEVSMDLKSMPAIGGDSLLTKRLMSDPEIREQYNVCMKKYFLDPGVDNLLGQISVELDRICSEVDRAVYYEPTYYYSYDEFISLKASLKEFLQNRGSTIADPPFIP